MAGGAKAQAWGKHFEDLFLHTCHQQRIAITRIPDSCKQLSAMRLIRTKSPFDWVISYNGKTALIDTKTVQGSTFSRSSISEHQVYELKQHEQAGIIAGYIIWMRKNDQIIFKSAYQLYRLMKEIDSKNNELKNETIDLGTSKDIDMRQVFIT